MPYNPQSLVNLGKPKTKAWVKNFRLSQEAIDYLSHFPNQTRIIECLIMNAASTYSTELYASDEFGDFALIVSPEQYKQNIQSCIESGFSEDFNPEPQVWDLIDPVSGIYETTYSSTADGKWRHVKVLAKMTWIESLGTFKSEEV
jgi:hypothetical protein